MVFRQGSSWNVVDLGMSLVDTCTRQASDVCVCEKTIFCRINLEFLWLCIRFVVVNLILIISIIILLPSNIGEINMF